MARVGYSDVQAIVTTSLTPAVLTALIEDAAAWVDAQLAGKLAEPLLTAIEKNLAAHLVVMTDESGKGSRIEAKRADISERNAERKGTVEGDTSYIRTAAAFDRTGLVKEHWLSKKRMMWRVADGYVSTGSGG